MSRPLFIAAATIALTGCATVERSSPFPKSVRCEQRAPDPVVTPDGSTLIVALLHAQDIKLTLLRAGWGEITFIPDEFDRFSQGKPIQTFAARVEDQGAERIFTSVSGEHAYSVEMRRTIIKSERGFVGRDRKGESEHVWLLCR